MRDNFIANRFLSHEAKLLDQRRFTEWLDLLDDEIRYIVPLRLMALDFDREVRADSFHINDGKVNLKVRAKRSSVSSGWGETPPSRTLRLVGSVMTDRIDQEGVLEVESAVIIYRQRAAIGQGDVLAFRRTDWLRIDGGTVKLLKRVALLTDASLATPNLAIFL
ncbi:hypothetical protein TZ53_25070 (plasmid) [Sphingobium sp. YBL2]|nr:hypothetical protein TZ53_25070 [Sphingobium sp. YBL2]